MVTFLEAKERLYKVLSGETVDRPPVLSATQTGTVELMAEANAYWPDANFSGSLMAKLALAGHTVAGLEAVRLPFCLTVLAESVGCDIDPGRCDRQPSIAKTLVDKGIAPKTDKLTESSRAQTIFEAIRTLKGMNLGVPIIVGFEGPLTLAGHMVGVERLCLMMIRKPDQAQEYIRKAEDACLIYAKALLQEGVDVIAPADPTSSPSVLSPRMFEKFAKEPLKQIASITKQSILHICGNATPIIAHMAECGFGGLSIEEKVDVAATKKVIGDRKIAIVGNVPSAGALLNGTEEDVLRESRNALAAGVDVLAPSCGIAPRTPTKNLKAMVKAVKG